ncbi:SagB family peptide dehydrogenase [Pandoraea sp. NPDC087047]|uniref:SagB family peptide dehydrogenase n=1 Tax=Pandoraea sp. NPDC087047 TaxID=3364390 RepID=UPI003826889B
MPTYFNRDIFLQVSKEQVVLWNVREHRQYSIDSAHAKRLVELALESASLDASNPIDEALLNGGAISNAPYPPESWGWDALARIFHIGTSDIPQPSPPTSGAQWANSNLAACANAAKHPIPPARDTTRGDSLRLPPPDVMRLQTASFWECCKTRSTCREFTSKPTDLQDVSTVLYGSLAFLRERTENVHPSVPSSINNRRTSPSGGGLNASEAYVVFQNVAGAPSGLFHYNPISHTLGCIKHSLSPDWLSYALSDQYFSRELGFGVFLAGRLDRMWWKYPHSRAYRVSLLDIGHLSQTFLLCATACGLHTWLSGAFRDREVRTQLLIQDDGEQPLFFVGAGHGTGDELDPERRAILSNSESIGASP